MGWRDVMANGPVPEGEQEQIAEADVPGWYPDPEDAKKQRWWDGSQWGAHWEEKPERVRPTGKANRLAVTALILACVGPIFVGGILATVFGYVSLDEIEDSGGKERGRAIGQWAIGLGFLNIALSCAAVVYFVSVLK